MIGPLILPAPGMLHSEPSWCEKHNCQCPCHDESAPWYFGPLLVLIIIAGAILFIWVVSTFCEWALPFGAKPTLRQVLIDQWHWLGDLLRRIW